MLFLYTIFVDLANIFMIYVHIFHLFHILQCNILPKLLLLCFILYPSLHNPSLHVLAYISWFADGAYIELI